MPATIITFTTPIAFEGDYEKRLVTTVNASKRTRLDEKAASSAEALCYTPAYENGIIFENL